MNAGDLQPRLAELIEKVGRGDPGRELDRPFASFGYGPTALNFEGETFAILRDLTWTMTSSALAAGGFGWEEAQTLVVGTIRVWLAEGEAQALARLDEELARPLSTWVVGEAVRGVFPLTLRVIGRAAICRGPEDVPGDPDGISSALLPDHDPHFPLLVAAVPARDRDSAVARAEDRFDEARAILLLATLGFSTPRPGHLILGSEQLIAGPRDESYIPQGLSPSGEFGFSLRGVEHAARKEGEDRTDWEARTVSAARWYRHAELSRWPSEALADCMTALDVLFVRDRHEEHKSERIAARVSERFRHPGLTADQLKAWIIDLYRNRNRVVHDGAHYLEDFEVERLRGIVLVALHWAGGHLENDHVATEPTGPCSTFDEVMACRTNVPSVTLAGVSPSAN
jgi:hypothetical protein